MSAIVIFTTRQNSIMEISEVGVQLPEWRVTPHLYVWQFTYKCGETVAHTTYLPNWVNYRVFAEERKQTNNTLGLAHNAGTVDTRLVHNGTGTPWSDPLPLMSMRQRWKHACGPRREGARPGGVGWGGGSDLLSQRIDEVIKCSLFLLLRLNPFLAPFDSKVKTGFPFVLWSLTGGLSTSRKWNRNGVQVTASICSGSGDIVPNQSPVQMSIQWPPSPSPQKTNKQTNKNLSAFSTISNAKDGLYFPAHTHTHTRIHGESHDLFFFFGSPFNTPDLKCTGGGNVSLSKKQQQQQWKSRFGRWPGHRLSL